MEKDAGGRPSDAVGGVLREALVEQLDWPELHRAAVAARIAWRRHRLCETCREEGRFWPF